MDQTPTERSPRRAPQPPDPVARAARKKRKNSRDLAKRNRLAAQTLKELSERFPKAIPRDPGLIRPWVLAFLEEVTAACPDLKAKNIKRALYRFHRIHLVAYLKALAAGGNRVHVDGTDGAAVSPDHQRNALKALETAAQENTVAGLAK